MVGGAHSTRGYIYSGFDIKMGGHYITTTLKLNPSPPRYFALIPAAGVGARMAANRPKQYLSIAGKSMLQHSVNAFLQHKQISHVFVVVSQDDAYIHELPTDPRLTVLFCGGATRADSVLNGLSGMQNQVNPKDWVLVHDAARPGLNTVLISRLIDTVGEDQVGGLLALPVVDTVKSQTANAVHTVPRERLWLAQTPQMFRHGVLLEALTKANKQTITDEASAIEMQGLVPKLVEGHWCNTKITHPDDLLLIESYLNQWPHSE
jgi:2-C-methyl-D-erythritol 4-phosphate cytidylyltransferase